MCEVLQQGGVEADYDRVHACQTDKPVEVEEDPELDAGSVVLVQLLHGGVSQQCGSDQEESVYAGKGIDYGCKQWVAKVGVAEEIC